MHLFALLQEPVHASGMADHQGHAVDDRPVYPDPAEYHPTVAELEAGAAMLGAGCQEACHCGCHAPHSGCDCLKPRGECPLQICNSRAASGSLSETEK